MYVLGNLGAIPAAGQSYTVQKGDSLSAIATRAYNVTGYRSWKPFGWAIYKANQALIDAEARRRKKPAPLYNWIFPGQVLTLPSYNEAAGIEVTAPTPSWQPSTPEMAVPYVPPSSPPPPTPTPTPVAKASMLPLVLGGAVVFGLLYMLFKKKA